MEGASEEGPGIEDYRAIALGASTSPINVAPGHGGVLGTSSGPPPPPENPEEPLQSSSADGGTITSSTITATTTDASGNTITTSYETAVGTGTSTQGAGCEGRNCSMGLLPSRTGGVVSLVPSWDAAARGYSGRGSLTVGGLAALILSVLGLF